MILNTIIPDSTKLRVSESSPDLETPPGDPKAQPNQAVQFTSAMAHEVRNPLSTINLAADLLKLTMTEPDQLLYLDMILRGSSRISDLITDLLASYQAVEIILEKHSVCDLLDEVLLSINDRILLKNITVRKDYSTADCNILVDKQKMMIALTNIIINAIDAMPAKNGKLKLTVKSVNGKSVIEIEDNGIGISPENLNNIFKPYYTNKPGGLGLGLSTTLEFLQSNRTKVNVQSEVGRGTRFILLFEGIHVLEELF